MDNNPTDMVTKKDLNHAVVRLKKYIEGEIGAVREYMNINMYTKADRERDLILMNKVSEEIDASREERILFGRQLQRMEDRWLDHEKRINAVEKA
jgi:hypothetical protein